MEDSLLEDMIGGYRSYADTEDLVVSAAGEAPATTPFCGFVASFAFSYVTTFGPG
ncbi:hypothetical protein ABIB25_001672 [Nakamurella sp. UYEF19]|uniref:LxmA leader domain family RiPP n=1 Tax=Nakamurella sp. UYEF19 TaxID=1756392 RepID=UPI00339B1338